MNISYFVVAIDYGRNGLESIVDPELTRNNVIDRIKSGEYDRERIAFIHFIHDGVCETVTDELIEAAGMPPENVQEIDLKVVGWDHRRDQRKHELV